MVERHHGKSGDGNLDHLEQPQVFLIAEPSLQPLRHEEFYLPALDWSFPQHSLCRESQHAQ